MVKRYIGGIISATAPITSNTSAGGFYNITNATQNIASGKWPSGTGLLINAQYLVVAGGGSGASGASQVGTGGGGAGGYLTGSIDIRTGTTYTITVGAGGSVSGNSVGGSGSNSSFDNLVLSYGGGGGGFWADTASSGGSGGGPGGSSTPGKGVYPGSTFISAPRQGYDGGNGVGTVGLTITSGGGGGGANGAGGVSTTTSAKTPGGPGANTDISGTLTTYASGGRGGGDQNQFGPGVAGPANSGNGGEGGSGGGGGSAGAAGGSGIVIIKVPDTLAIATTTGSPTVTTTGGFRIYKYTSSGSITF